MLPREGQSIGFASMQLQKQAETLKCNIPSLYNNP